MHGPAAEPLLDKAFQPESPAESDRLTLDILRAQHNAQRLILEGRPLREILEALAEAVEALDDRSAVASILLLDPEGRLRTGAAPRLPDTYNDAIDGVRARVGLGTCAHAAATGEVVITPSIEDCPRWKDLKQLPLGIGLKAAWSQPILASDGSILGTFGTYFHNCRQPTEIERRLVETLAGSAALAIERDREERERRSRERLHRRALEAADMGAWRYDLSSRLVHVDEKARELYGVEGDSFCHDEESVRAVLHPDDIAAMWEAVETACDPEGDGRYQAEYRTRAPDGGWRWLSVWGLADFRLVEGQRRPVAINGASRDVSAARAATEQQQLLLRELSHRVRNNLAVVQSIAQQTLRTKSNPAEFSEAFNGRIAALAKAHSLLTKTEWRGASLRGIAEAALEGFGGTDGSGSFTISGEDVVVPASAAVTLSLVFHELATNAHKYGALSADGTVMLRWTTTQDDDGGRTVDLDWRETGGPPPAEPSRTGFGSKLIAIGTAQLKGETSSSFGADGFACTLRFQVPEEPALEIAQGEQPA